MAVPVEFDPPGIFPIEDNPGPGNGNSNASDTHSQHSHLEDDYFLKQYKGRNLHYKANKDKYDPMLYDFMEIIDFDRTGLLSAENLDEAADVIRISATAKANNTAELNYKHMPAAVSRVLEQWDADKSGTVGISELIMAAEAQKKMKDENRLIKKLLMGAVVVIIILLAATFGLSITAAELAKDSVPDETGVQKMKDGTPVAMGAAKTSYALQDFASLTAKQLMNIDEVAFTHKGEWHRLKVTSMKKGGAAVSLGLGNGQWLIIKQDKTVTLDGAIVDLQEGRRLMERRERMLSHPVGSGDGAGSGWMDDTNEHPATTLPPGFHGPHAVPTELSDPTPAPTPPPAATTPAPTLPLAFDEDNFKPCSSQMASGLRRLSDHRSHDQHHRNLMGSGAGGGGGGMSSGMPSCDDSIKMTDLDGNNVVSEKEWTAEGNCYDPNEFYAFDTNGDGKLTPKDCQDMAMATIALLGEVALHPRCDGPVNAPAMPGQ